MRPVAVRGSGFDRLAGSGEPSEDGLVVERGTADSVKRRDSAYRRLVVQNAVDHGPEFGYFADLDVSGKIPIDAFG